MSQQNQGTPAPTRGVPVMLDKERHFRITFTRRREIIKEVGGEENLKKLAGDKITIVVWQALLHEDPSLTLEQVEEMVDMENLPEIVDALARAMGYKEKPQLVIGEGGQGNSQGSQGESSTSP